MTGPLMFSRPLCAAVFWLLYAFWFGFEIWNKKRAGRSDSGTNRDGGSGLIVSTAIGAGVFMAFFLAYRLPIAAMADPTPFFWLGCTGMLAGQILRVWSVRTLGKSFRYVIGARPSEPIVERGPYAKIRHPAYAAGMMTVLGISLAVGNWASVLVAVGCTVIGYAYRIAVEEKVLHDELGEAYDSYARRTKRLIPYVF